MLFVIFPYPSLAACSPKVTWGFLGQQGLCLVPCNSYLAKQNFFVKNLQSQVGTQGLDANLQGQDINTTRKGYTVKLEVTRLDYLASLAVV